MARRRLEEITEAYWAVGTALRHPDAPGLSCEHALALLNKGDKLRPEEWRLRELMHTARFDIIEGNTEWREKQQAIGSISTLPTRD
jgi:hypothetical protein